MPAFDLTSALPAAADAFRSAQRITAICHATPDADTIGGASAVAIMARKLGKQAEIVSTDRPAPVFNFLDGIPDARTAPQLEPDLAVICDAATLERVGPIAREQAEWFSRARILNVDHHISNDGFGHVNLVDPHAAATCQVLAGLVRELGVELDAPLATALLTGIIRDSQGFSDKSTTSKTLRIAADLVDAGAPIADIHRLVLIELPYPTLALWGRMLAGIGERQGGRVVYATLTQRMLDETGTQQHDADGLAEFLARAKEAQVTLLLRELGPNETRVSVRCADGVDATVVAAPFGGGGHRTRSGATVRAWVDDALPQVLAAAEAALPA
ncbi:MAG TPA: DHH family phosphoesterase [Candidatus Limnocylindria bacterium]|nr:DHH family phosphoesterase [Candidatus Limnocylindria bacterium]